MTRSVICVLVLGMFAAVCLIGCGEKAVEPGNPAGGAVDLGRSAQAPPHGGRAATAERAGWGHGHDKNAKGTFLIASEGGIVAVDRKGNSFLFSTLGTHTSNVEVLGTRIFWMGGTDIVELDHMGNAIATISIPDWITYALDFTVLPDGNFALQDCKADSVYFMDPTGYVFEAIAMPEASPMSLQNMRGLVLDGRLLISETGTKKIAEIDLATYTARIFRDFSVPLPMGWFGDINHQGRYYYIARPRSLDRFSEDGDLENIADFGDEGAVTGIAILRHKAYVTINFAGKLYEVNLSSGKAKCLVKDLDFPGDVEFIPVVLEPPSATP